MQGPPQKAEMVEGRLFDKFSPRLLLAHTENLPYENKKGEIYRDLGARLRHQAHTGPTQEPDLGAGDEATRRATALAEAIELR